MVDLRRFYEMLRETGARLVRHRKRHSVEPYVVLGEGEAQCSSYDIREGDPVVVYLSSTGSLYVRHKDEFESGRFYEVQQ